MRRSMPRGKESISRVSPGRRCLYFVDLAVSHQWPVRLLSADLDHHEGGVLFEKLAGVPGGVGGEKMSGLNIN